MDRIESKRQAQFRHQNPRSSLSVHRIISRAGPLEPHNNSKNDNYKFRNRHNKHVYAIGTLVLSLLSPTASLAADVGGVSATANPIANSSGSVTNQAIQVLQGPYITNTYGGGIQCQGPTMNITPYVTGSASFQKPWEEYYDDPVYDVHDADDDGQIDNPGNILYYVPTRTGQKDTYNVSLGLSATWSRPLDKNLQNLCKTAAATQIGLQKQLTANKRLDFEIARLKNCGELMKAGIMFHPQSPYAKVCADVVLTNPPGVVAQHSHALDGVYQYEPPTNSQTSSSSTVESPSSDLSDLPSSDEQIEDQTDPSSRKVFGLFRWPVLWRDEKLEEEDQPAALLGGPIQWPPSQSQQSSKQPAE